LVVVVKVVMVIQEEETTSREDDKRDDPNQLDVKCCLMMLMMMENSQSPTEVAKTSFLCLFRGPWPSVQTAADHATVLLILASSVERKGPCIAQVSEISFLGMQGP
jgi:hypothetical protein